MSILNPMRVQQRRLFLQETACGLGTLALGQLLAEDGWSAPPEAGVNPLQPKPPHHTPTAKNVIFLFQAGAPSQLDLFDPKPELKRLHKQPVPASFLENLDDALIRGSARLFASPRTFTRHGQCGMEFSDYLPHLAGCADDLCMIRSMVTDVSNHHPGQLLMNCGMPRFGLPSMGSWITYGLGSESHNLPGFVVLLSRNGPGDLGGSALWDSAFLPAANRGVTFRTEGDAILHLSSPKGVTPGMQRERLAAIVDMNRLRHTQHSDPAIRSRIASY